MAARTLPGTPSLPVPSALWAQKGLGAEEQEGRRSERMKEKEEGEPGKGGGKKHGEAESRKTAMSEALARVLPINLTTQPPA